MWRASARPQRHIVLVKPGCDLEEAAEVVRHCGAAVLQTIPLIHGLLCTCPGPATVAALAGHATVSAIEPDFRLPLPRVWSTGWLFARNQQLPWGLERIGVSRAWERSQGAGVRVAVIDTGADWEHPDLNPNIRGGFNVLRPEDPPTDDNGHGTHVAGIVAAADNLRGVIGVAPRCDLHVVKAFDRYGTGATADVLLGLQWCADHGMQVVKMTGNKGGGSPWSGFGCWTGSPLTETCSGRTVR